VARPAAVEAARCSFEAAHAAVSRRCEAVTGKRQVGQAVMSAAGNIASFCAARVPGACTASALLVISADANSTWIRAEAAKRSVTVHIVIDLIHVLEYIWKAAWTRHPAGDPAAGDWVAARAVAVLAGDSARAAAEITAEADAAGLAAAQRAGAGACVRYLTGKQEFLRYDQALAAGWPIATGVIEGACRHLIGDRPDITGTRWRLQGAEAVLTLRAAQQRRLRRVLALPPHPRTPAAIPRHSTTKVHTPRLTPHSKRAAARPRRLAQPRPCSLLRLPTYRRSIPAGSAGAQPPLSAAQAPLSACQHTDGCQ
jgi:hypothetical protein